MSQLVASVTVITCHMRTLRHFDCWNHNKQAVELFWQLWGNATTVEKKRLALKGVCKARLTYVFECTSKDAWHMHVQKHADPDRELVGDGYGLRYGVLSPDRHACLRR